MAGLIAVLTKYAQKNREISLLRGRSIKLKPKISLAMHRKVGNQIYVTPSLDISGLQGTNTVNLESTLIHPQMEVLQIRP
jgi:hypothetical protein